MIDIVIGSGKDGRGKLVTLKHLDNETASDLRQHIEAYIPQESKDIYMNLWDVREKGEGFLIDIYVEDSTVLKRLEEYLSMFGYRLRLTPKPIIVS